MLINSLDDLPSEAEITPGTITIERKVSGGTSWTAIETNTAMLENAGLVYFDEVFDSGAGYAGGDSIRITFKSQKITVAANDYEITDSTGVMFQTYIRASGGLGTAAIAELSAIPSGDPTELEMVQFLYQYFKHERIGSGSAAQEQMKKRNGTTLGIAGLESDGTDFTRKEFAT